MKIINAEEIPEGEEVFVKKDWTGWRVVEPIIHPTTRKFIWKNFFSRKGFLLLFVLLLIGFSFYYDAKRYIEQYNEIIENPCPYCKECHTYATQMCGSITTQYQPFNVSLLNLST